MSVEESTSDGRMSVVVQMNEMNEMIDGKKKKKKKKKRKRKRKWQRKKEEGRRKMVVWGFGVLSSGVQPWVGCSLASGTRRVGTTRKKRR